VSWGGCNTCRIPVLHNFMPVQWEMKIAVWPFWLFVPSLSLYGTQPRNDRLASVARSEGQLRGLMLPSPMEETKFLESDETEHLWSTMKKRSPLRVSMRLKRRLANVGLESSTRPLVCRRLQQANGTSAFAHVFVPVRFRRKTSFYCSYTTIFILDNNYTLLQAFPTLLKAVRHQGRAINRGSLSGYGAVMNDLQLSPRWTLTS
jgi:hypothetical protein